MARAKASGGGSGKARSPDADGIRLLARRPLTEHEVRERLASRGHGAQDIERTIGRLQEAGYIDDADLALEFIAARSERLGHGRKRLIDDLRRRGVGPDVAEAAWVRAVEQGAVSTVDLVRRQIRRRVAGRPALDFKAYARVYNALLRAGFDGATVRQELEPFRDTSGHSDTDLHEWNEP